MFRILGVLLLLLSGCGYTFQGSGSVLPPDVRKIYIPTAVNDTAETGVADLVTEAIQDRFERYGVIHVVENIGSADAILKSKILDIERETRTSTSNTDIAVQYQSRMVIAAELRRVTGETLWKNNQIAASKSFGTDTGGVVTSSADFATNSLNSDDLSNLSDRNISRGQEAEVLETLAEEAAKRIYQEAVAPEF